MTSSPPVTVTQNDALRVGDVFTVTETRRTLGKWVTALSPVDAAYGFSGQLKDSLRDKGYSVDSRVASAAWLDGFDYTYTLEVTVLDQWAVEDSAPVSRAAFGQIVIVALLAIGLVFMVGWSIVRPSVEFLKELNKAEGAAAKTVNNLADAAGLLAVVAVLAIVVYFIFRKR